MNRKKLGAQIGEMVEEWVVLLNLGQWDVTWGFVDDLSDICPAEISFHWEYMTAAIAFNPRVMASRSKAQRESHIVHELCHLLIAELESTKRKHIERVVTQLTNAFISARTAGYTSRSESPSHQ